MKRADAGGRPDPHAGQGRGRPHPHRRRGRGGQGRRARRRRSRADHQGRPRHRRDDREAGGGLGRRAIPADPPDRSNASPRRWRNRASTSCRACRSTPAAAGGNEGGGSLPGADRHAAVGKGRVDARQPGRRQRDAAAPTAGDATESRRGRVSARSGCGHRAPRPLAQRSDRQPRKPGRAKRHKRHVWSNAPEIATDSAGEGIRTTRVARQGGAPQKTQRVRPPSYAKLERAKGFEPSTPTLARLCSTPELRPL